MGLPAAKMGDRVVGVDIHIVLVPAPPAPPVPTPLPHKFDGIISDGLSTDVKIQGMPAAVMGSKAKNMPPHFPTPPGTSFAKPPMNQATIIKGSMGVFINKKPAARMGDIALDCGDPVDAPTGVVQVQGATVFIG